MSTKSDSKAAIAVYDSHPEVKSIVAATAISLRSFRLNESAFSSAGGRLTCIKHFQRAHGCGTPGLDAEFFKYFLNVLFDCGRGDTKNRCDVGIRLALGKPEQRFGRARSQAQFHLGVG